MGTEKNKEMVRRLYEEVVNKNNIDLVDKFVPANAIENEDLNYPGRESFKKFFTAFRAAFPDLHFEIEDMIAEGDKVVVRITVTGTNNGVGDFMGIAPTGKKIKMETIDIFRFEGEMMIEHWGRTDTLGMLDQLGIKPTQEVADNIRVDP